MQTSRAGNTAGELTWAADTYFSTLCCSPVTSHTGRLRSGADQVLKALRDSYGSKAEEEGNPKKEKQHIHNIKRKSQGLAGDGMFSNVSVVDFHSYESPEKSTLLFVSPACPVPNLSDGPEYQHICSVGDPPVEARGKVKAPHTTARATVFSPTALHGASTAGRGGGGGLAACQIRAGKV